MTRLRRWRVLAGAALLTTALAACGQGRDGPPERFVQPDAPKTSPSGEFTAHVEPGPDQNGVATRVVVITDSSGDEVFRDDYAYSTRHGVGVTWLSTADQLWILSADVGMAHVDRQADGGWTKTEVWPEDLDRVPEEIDSLR